MRTIFHSGEYPYKTRMKRSVYEQQKASLQIELLKMQSWVKESGQRVVLLFEGRDAAGKGGTIKRITQSLNPRVCRVVALGKPTERDRADRRPRRRKVLSGTAGQGAVSVRSADADQCRCRRQIRACDRR